MKRLELTIAFLLVPLDFCALLLASIVAYHVRFFSYVTELRPVIFALDFSSYLQILIPIIFVWLIIYALTGLYNIRHPRKILVEIGKIIVASSLGFAMITVFIFLRGELFSSRFIILASYLLAIVFVIAVRLIVRLIKFIFYKKGIGVRRVILVGDDKNTRIIYELLKNSYSYGLKVVDKLMTISPQNLASIDLKKIRPDLILLGAVDVHREPVEMLLDYAKENNIEFHYAADLFETKSSQICVSALGDIPIIEIKQSALDGWGRISKRIFDLLFGLIFLLLASPWMLLIAIAIKIDSKGPIIYKNQRVGKGGKIFNVYKFRRMKQNLCTGQGYDSTGLAAQKEAELIKQKSHRDGPLYKISHDPRNTRVGAFIEKTSLDELPQFFNVIWGSLSLVGPRPHQEREVQKYQRHHKRVLAIKPGVTGLAQISGRSDLDFEEEVRLDTFYVENWSLRLDLAVLLKTPFALLKKHK